MEKNMKKNYVCVCITESLRSIPETSNTVNRLCIKTKTKRCPETHQGSWVFWERLPWTPDLPPYNKCCTFSFTATGLSRLTVDWSVWVNRSKSGSVTTPLFNFISLHFPSSSQLSPKLNHLLFPAYAGFPTSGRSSSCFFPWCGSSSPNNALLQSESESLSRSVVSDSLWPHGL